MCTAERVARSRVEAGCLTGTRRYGSQSFVHESSKIEYCSTAFFLSWETGAHYSFMSPEVVEGKIRCKKNCGVLEILGDTNIQRSALLSLVWAETGTDECIKELKTWTGEVPTSSVFFQAERGRRNRGKEPEGAQAQNRWWDHLKSEN